MFKKNEGTKKQQEDKNPLCDKPAEEKPQDKPQDELQKKIEELEKQKNEYLEGWKKERADFLNYKKEEMERIVELMKYANEELILKILPILDNFFVAEKNIPQEMKSDKNVAGLLQIHQQLKDFLKSQGIEEIKAVGERFNPNFHEVVEEVSRSRTPTEIIETKESGIVVEEVQKGYTLFGKVIRPARVKISK